MQRSNVFDVELKVISNDIILHIININTYSNELENYIDQSISKICYGDEGNDLVTIKRELSTFFENKINDPNKVMGSIAEFMMQVYLNEIGFKQEFVFLNLEEGSLKKGFDGYFTYINEEWIFESKSGSINTQGISHDSKIKEAYRDLKEKTTTNTQNNPWKNAFTHAKFAGSNSDILKKLKNLSNQFINGVFQEIADINLMPGSTIFLEESWDLINSNELETKLRNYFANREYKRLNIICINQRSTNLFLDYLKK
jgi:hypothetical protein